MFLYMNDVFNLIPYNLCHVTYFGLCLMFNLNIIMLKLLFIFTRRIRSVCDIIMHILI
jgi:hypothetical protein